VYRARGDFKSKTSATVNQFINGHSSEMLTPDREQVSTQNNLENKKGKITKE